MSGLTFTRATKKQAKLRLALESPAGFGKTYTALQVATVLAGDKRIALVDTEGVTGDDEGGAAAKYAHIFDFDTIALAPPFHPNRLIEAIGVAVANDYGVFIADSLSHFWQGKGGLLEIVDQIARTKYRNDSHRAWADAGKIQQDLVDAILRSPIHIIATMRTKKDFVRETVEKDGREVTRIRAAGTKVVQRDDFDYEFDIVGRFETPAVLTILKSRCDTLPPDTFLEKPGAEFATTLAAWLDAGEPPPPPPAKPTAKDRKALDAAIAKLHELKPETDWNNKADSSAVQKFGHGLALVSKDECVGLTESMATYAAELETQQNGQAALAGAGT